VAAQQFVSIQFSNITKNLSLVALASCLFGSGTAFAQDVIVHGNVDAISELIDAEGWFGEQNAEQKLEVPRILITGMPEDWQRVSAGIPASKKKEIFYSFMLPLIVQANELVRDRRAKLEDMDARLAKQQQLRPDEYEWLGELVVLLRIPSASGGLPESVPEQRRIIAEALYKLDVIPAGLVLGQGAYESGYGTSRFAVQANAFFGQWTFDGDGIVPMRQRKNLGDYRIAAYASPFDSVRGYYASINSHPAYENFRRLRAESRAAGKPLSSLELAEGLGSYSELGQEYVGTLQSIIRVNKLNAADGAVFRDEPMRFFVIDDDVEAAEQLQAKIEELRKAGKLQEVSLFDRIIERMQLEYEL